MFIYHILESVSAVFAFVLQDVVVRWSGCPRNRFMGTEVKIIFKWVGYISLNQCAWKRILLRVARVGKKPDMMPLLSNYNSEF